MSRRLSVKSLLGLYLDKDGKKVVSELSCPPRARTLQSQDGKWDEMRWVFENEERQQSKISQSKYLGSLVIT